MRRIIAWRLDAERRKYMNHSSSTATKRVLVTGGGSGIGAATAQALSHRGFAVAIADIDRVSAQSVAARLPGAKAFYVNVTNAESTASLFSEIDEQWAGLDGLVHCPGIGVTKSFLEVTREDWDQVMAVNLQGAFLCCTHAARRMAAGRGGSIVALSSVAAQRPSAMTAPYSSSKAALELMIMGLAMELGRERVRANVVAPGATDTPLVRVLHTGDRRARFTSRIPLARYAQPEEIAAAATFLISDDSSNVTGQILYIDGGMSIANVLATPQPEPEHP